MIDALLFQFRVKDKDFKRPVLQSHTIVFAQEPLGVPKCKFNDEFIRAALKNLRVEFVGPKGWQTQLERAALDVPALRLDPVRVFNGLVRLALVGQRLAPDFNEIQRVLSDTNYIAEIVHEACDSIVTDDELDAAAENLSSDIAGVRGLRF